MRQTHVDSRKVLPSHFPEMQRGLKQGSLLAKAESSLSLVLPANEDRAHLGSNPCCTGMWVRVNTQTEESSCRKTMYL